MEQLWSCEPSRSRSGQGFADDLGSRLVLACCSGVGLCSPGSDLLLGDGSPVDRLVLGDVHPHVG